MGHRCSPTRARAIGAPSLRVACCFKTRDHPGDLTRWSVLATADGAVASSRDAASQQGAARRVRRRLGGRQARRARDRDARARAEVIFRRDDTLRRARALPPFQARSTRSAPAPTSARSAGAATRSPRCARRRSATTRPCRARTSTPWSRARTRRPRPRRRGRGGAVRVGRGVRRERRGREPALRGPAERGGERERRARAAARLADARVIERSCARRTRTSR